MLPLPKIGMQRNILLVFFLCFSSTICAQISGHVQENKKGLAGASVYIESLSRGGITDDNGYFNLKNIPQGKYTLVVSYIGFIPKKIDIDHRVETTIGNIELMPDPSLDEVVVSSKLQAVNRLQSTIPVEVYAPSFLQKNPTPSLFEGVQFINGIRPQINCAVCNTGDIHINGLEGPYTFVLIDGMPLVSSLASVYGLNGIPNAMIEKIEVVKGPAGTLYGSQAVGGLINVITKLPEYAPALFVDGYGTSWQAFNIDLGFSSRIGKKGHALTGINGYSYSVPIDHNGDNFTDATLQNRFSIFQKFNWKARQDHSLAFRYLYEDRWGGEMQWTPANRGGTEVYGESIYTSRFEILGNHQFNALLRIQYSYTHHDQNSVYGDTFFSAKEETAFVQLIGQKNTPRHQWIGGLSVRYNAYDDNTPATYLGSANNPNQYWLPGVFLEDEFSIGNRSKILMGVRLDHHRQHGVIFTPRGGLKYNWDDQTLFRINAGTGFRVVNVFTEDHAALTGARTLVIEDDIQPENSWNINANFYKKIYTSRGWIFGIDASAWHTYFSNQIIPDYDSHPNEIRYGNLDGHAVSQGIGVNFNAIANQFNAQLGITLMHVYFEENGLRQRPLFTEKWSATWAVSTPLWNEKTSMDYTGNIYGSMRLPQLGARDPRRANSPVWSIQNIKFNYRKNNTWTFFGGIKNLLNWTPAQGNPFLIARAQDPFDREVSFDSSGNAIATPNNPDALSFDPSYAYAPNLGRRIFIGCNYSLQK